MEKGIAKDNNEENEYSGWPLCLEPMNIRIRLLDTLSPAEEHANAINLGSSGFSSISSSNLETERSSSSSFCHKRTITLGEILGMSVAGLSTRVSARFASTVSSFRSLELNECGEQSKKSFKKIWKCIGMWCYNAENEEPCYASHSHEKDVLQMYEKVYTNAIFEEDSYKNDHSSTNFWANHPMIDVGQYWSSDSQAQNEKGFTFSSWCPSDLPVRIDLKPCRQRLSTKILRKFGSSIARSSSFF